MYGNEESKEEHKIINNENGPAKDNQNVEPESAPPVKYPCYLVSKSNLLQNYNIELSQKLIKILSPNKGKVKS